MRNSLINFKFIHHESNQNTLFCWGSNKPKNNEVNVFNNKDLRCFHQKGYYESLRDLNTTKIALYVENVLNYKLDVYKLCQLI